ncbi:MAG TPA: hypothetical protein VEZ71_20610, partial [Archangium sp.]|nr:hypothetical protein [Archangium sp.]
TEKARAAQALTDRIQMMETERAGLRERIEQLQARKPVSDSEAILEMSEELERLQGEFDTLQRTLTERDLSLAEQKRRLEEQEAELASLKKLSARKGADTVQDIYARANAELNAVKNELLRRPKGSTPATVAPASTPKPEDPV